MRRWWLLIALLWCTPAAAQDTLSVRLLFTLPSFNAALDDSGNPSCGVGADPLQDLDSVVVFGTSATGGSLVFGRVYAKSVRGMEGLPDSASFKIPRWVGGTFYMISKDRSGNPACASGTVYVGTTSGVPVPAPAPVATRVAYCRLFDVRGRTVGVFPTGRIWDELKRRRSSLLTNDLLVMGIHDPLARGVYYLQGRTFGGRDVSRSVVYLK